MKYVQLESYNTAMGSGLLYYRLYQEIDSKCYVFGVIYENGAISIDLKTKDKVWNDFMDVL